MTLIPCIFFDIVHVHLITYPTNDEQKHKLGSIFPFSLSHDNGNMVNPPIYAHIAFQPMEFVHVYMVFTISVQAKCTNCTRVYKVTFLEGIPLIFKNSLAHFPLLRIRDIPQTHFLMAHSSHAFCLPCTCSFDYLPH